MSNSFHGNREDRGDVTVCQESGVDHSDQTNMVVYRQFRQPVTCPACGAQDNYAYTENEVSNDSSNSLLRTLFSVLGMDLTNLFYVAGQPRKGRCKECGNSFEIYSPFTRLSRVVFWILLACTLIMLIFGVLGIVYLLSGK